MLGTKEAGMFAIDSILIRLCKSHVGFKKINK